MKSIWILAAMVTVLPATGAFAAEPYLGKWAAKASECKSDALFTFSPKKVVGSTFACDSASYATDGAGWKVAAGKCSSEEGDTPKMNFRLVIDAGKLQVLWSDGTKSAALVKCGS